MLLLCSFFKSAKVQMWTKYPRYFCMKRKMTLININVTSMCPILWWIENGIVLQLACDMYLKYVTVTLQWSLEVWVTFWSLLCDYLWWLWHQSDVTSTRFVLWGCFFKTLCIIIIFLVMKKVFLTLKNLPNLIKVQIFFFFEFYAGFWTCRFESWSDSYAMQAPPKMPHPAVSSTNYTLSHHGHYGIIFRWLGQVEIIFFILSFHFKFTSSPFYTEIISVAIAKCVSFLHA